MSDWYQRTTDDALQTLGVDASRGLDDSGAARRLAESGPNVLIDSGMKSPWRILWEQFSATMVLILIIAALVSGLLGRVNETVSILAIVVLFGLLGFAQEYRAEKALAALKKMAAPQVRVRRGGGVRQLPARDLVPGDIVLLEAGNIVPADGRIIESAALAIQESMLTGESEPAAKITAPLSGDDLPLGDRHNMAYMGTLVTGGRGALVVTATGMRAELGRIAAALQSVHETQTPLQVRLDQLGQWLAVAGLAAAALVMGLGLLRGDGLRETFLLGVSVAVAVVPEGLPAVVTFTLALGARRLLKRQALIRKLPAVETLGAVTVICSDKTGTLTENRMTVVMLDAAGHRLDMQELDPRHALAGAARDGVTSPVNPAFMLLVGGGALCNDASLRHEPGGTETHVLGDPTEAAMVVAAARLGLLKDELDRRLERVAELPFDSERKRMTTVHRAGIVPGLDLPAAPYVAFTKGAVDGILGATAQVWMEGHVEPLTAAWRTRIESSNDDLAARGMRVLGVAFRPLAAIPDGSALEQDLIFVGLIALIDPPRAEAQAAVQTSRDAGIRPIMITGDHPLTARAIAGQLGITADGAVVSGQALNAMSDAELSAALGEVSVFARVSPAHKLRIVEALQARGHIVAMTGDGVNDAPALRRADIGVAMGITGTDVSKQASDMVLLDDNFATIVAAVAEGRTIYNNVRRFVKFSVGGNIGKIAVMVLAPLLGMPLPLLPLQLLWLNLLTDGLLGLGLGVEPSEVGVMRRPPRPPGESILGDGTGAHMAWLGAFIALLAGGAGWLYWMAGQPGWQTMVFSTLAFAQVAQALAVRSARASLLRVGLLTNKPLALLAALVGLLQLAVLFIPPLQVFFHVMPLGVLDIAISMGLGSLVLWASELEKAVLRLRCR